MGHTGDPLPHPVPVGFIGLGVMGASMAGHLQRAGHPLTVFTRTRAKADALLASGAEWAATPADVARAAEVVFTIVGAPADVEDVYLNPETGLFAGSRPTQVFVDMTTSSPALAARLAEEGAVKGVSVLDAPVSGGDVGARQATLSIMVGGGAEAFARVEPLFRLLGKSAVLQGPAGSGQHTKMANQIAVAASMFGACEALAYAKAAGLDPAQVLESISGGAAGSWTLNHLAPRILRDDFAPGFAIHHFVKDLGIALESARGLKQHLPALALAEATYRRLRDDGLGEAGTQALFQDYM